MFMSAKQDRTGVRTPAQLEQKYSFGKKFSEIIGLIDDSRDKVDSVSSELRNEIEEVSKLSRSTSEITASVEKRVKTVEDDVSTLKTDTSTLTQTATDITAKVTAVETNVGNLSTDVGNLSTDVSILKNEVEMKIDADKVGIAIRAELVDGVDKVTTETGYVFDSDGLTISKSGEQMENKIDNTGMYVTRAGVDILTANHQGVTATNLYASTYLIIGAYGGRSRFEDYGTNRTGCYWIGG
jgi:archaellum component FlaC